MKSIFTLLSALLVAFVGWRIGAPQHPEVIRGGASTPRRSPLPNITVRDPAEVFQKAFWKRPAAEDQILHAERREWRDGAGISKWQWFVSVKPSGALVDHLITNNAFGLVASGGGAQVPATDLPPWFPKEAAAGAKTFSGATGTFILVWDKEHNLLHATDSGGGFRPGAPQPARPVASPSAPAPSQPAGRLPTTPPPKPEP